jgi:hypothetical protein
MPIWLDADGTNGGHIAIYTGNDDAPMANPASYIGTRTKFSTKFNYIPFVPARKIGPVSITVPAKVSYSGRGDPMRRTINLGAHGMPGIPFIYGFVRIGGGTPRPLCGSVPVRWNLTTGDTIHFTLGLNATNVFISEGRSYPEWSGGSTSTTVEVFISDKLAA